MNTFINGFNAVAKKYSEVFDRLPADYIDLIQKTFGIEKKHHIIDLGCGAGLLTFELSKLTDFVEGLDISSEMIRIAKECDHNKKINWICCPVEEYSFKKDFYSLIISLESFHLFANQPTLLERFYGSLKSQGSICIAWCQFHWEEFLKNCIIKSFKSFGIGWGEWRYQSCAYFSDILRQCRLHSQNCELKASLFLHQVVFNR